MKLRLFWSLLGGLAAVGPCLVACGGATSSSSSTTDADAATGAIDGSTPPSDGGTRPPTPTLDAGAVDSSTVDGGTGIDDAGASSCGALPPGAATDGGVCNGVVPAGTLIPEVCSTDAPPIPHGGSVEDGTYYLETETFYGSSCPSPLTQDRVVWIVCGSSWQSAQAIGSAPVETFAVLVEPGDAASSLTFDITCPFRQVLTYEYDVTPGHFSLFLLDPIGQVTEVDTYAKQ